MSESPIHILLIEDDDAYAALLRRELEAVEPPFSVARAATLGAALAALASREPDAILLDIGLPDSTGLEALSRIQALLPDTAVIVLTARDDDALALEAVQQGAQDYLVKSQSAPDLVRRAIRYARERASLRRELSEAAARFRALVEYSQDAITLLDDRHISLYNSRSVERLSGYRPEELNGRDLNLFAHPEDVPELRRRFGECLEHPGRPVPIEYRYLHKDGAWRFGEGVAVNRLDDPAVKAIVVNHRDVTERKAAEQALRAREEQLRQAHKMEAVGRLAGGVAHDFNNVLTAIFGYADLLLDQFGTDDPRRADIEEIRRSAERAAALTRQLLAFSRKQVMQPRVVHLNDVVASLERLLVRLVGEDVEVENRFQRDLWPVLADPGQIEQVLMNLAANARDAMPEGGRLLIETSNVEVTADTARELPGLGPGHYAELSVQDTGHGIPADVQAHIFEPFFTTKDQGKGTGLGLATVYGIVKQTGGGVYLQSAGKNGTRFRVLLPRVP